MSSWNLGEVHHIEDQLRTVSHHWLLAWQERRGYNSEAIRGILHGNWVRFFRQAWGASR